MKLRRGSFGLSSNNVGYPPRKEIPGNSVVEKLHHIDRGYENFENKIRLLGGKIERRVEESPTSLTEVIHNESYL